MTILAIDPGNERSAYVVFNTTERSPVEFQKISNAELLSRVEGARGSATRWCGIEHLAIEMIASYGMAVGREVFETCVFIGRLIQAWNGPHTLVYRKDVKLHLCGQPRAKDANIRAALIDLWGGKEKAIGKKHSAGPLYGVSADVWSALAIAVTYTDANKVVTLAG